MPTGVYKKTVKHKKKLSEALKGKNHPMYGKKHTEESKQKMSEKAKGRKHTAKHKKNMSEAKKGKNHPYYGKKRSDEYKRKMSEALKGKYMGELNSQWKGGISCEPYCDVWIDKEYKESIKERDNYTCQNPLCLCDSSKLCIHHVNYVKKDCKPNNLITVCNSSNSRANKDRWVWQDIYERVVERAAI